MYRFELVPDISVLKSSQLFVCVLSALVDKAHTCSSPNVSHASTGSMWSSLYEHLLQRQSPDGKRQSIEPEHQGQEDHGKHVCEEKGREKPCKRAPEESTPRYKLKLQRHVSEASVSSHGEHDNEHKHLEGTVGGNETQVLAGGKTPVLGGNETPVVGGNETPVVGGNETQPYTGNLSDLDIDKRMFEELFSDPEPIPSKESTSSAAGTSLPIMAPEPGKPAASRGPTSPVPVEGKASPVEGKNNLLITRKDNFNLVQECMAAGYDLSGKNPSEALEMLLGVLANRVPPEDALLVGLVCQSEVSTKVPVETVLATARNCLKDVRGAAVQIKVEKRKRPDTHFNVVFTCKVQGQQVGSSILKPYEQDVLLFNLSAAVRISLAWRCIPLLHMQNVSDVTCETGWALSDIVKAWLQTDLFLLAFADDHSITR